MNWSDYIVLAKQLEHGDSRPGLISISFCFGVNRWSSCKAKSVLPVLLRIGWQIKHQSRSHRTLSRDSWPDVVNEIGVLVSTLDETKPFELTGKVPQNVNFAIRGEITREFMRSYVSIVPDLSSTEKKDTAAIAGSALNFTIPVECQKMSLDRWSIFCNGFFDIVQKTRRKGL
ncbi:MAG: hypothetical protein ACRERV_02325 [Methylococcales bacterium]